MNKSFTECYTVELSLQGEMRPLSYQITGGGVLKTLITCNPFNVSHFALSIHKAEQIQLHGAQPEWRNTTEVKRKVWGH